MGCTASSETVDAPTPHATAVPTAAAPPTPAPSVEEPAPDTPLSLRSSDADRGATLPQTPPGPLDAASNIAGAVLAASRPRESPEAEHLVSLPLSAPAAMRTFPPVEQFSSGAPSLGPLRVSAKDLRMPPPPSRAREAPASVAALGRPPGGGPKRRFLAGSSAFGSHSSTAATMSGDSLLDSNVVQNPLLTPPPFSRP